jgi:3-phenylpropionate/trans-cinnamate dioxygenase ferredoxin reductase component
MAGGLVIVGASLAGMRAAQAARNADYEGELTLIGEEQHMPYTRPPLSKDLLAGIDDVGSCHFPADGLEVTWRLGERATALDSGARRVMLDGGEAVEYDQVVLATGCRARPWPGPGGELEGVYTLRHLDDALALQRALAGRPKLAIVGAGFIGCEVAASARKLGIDVTLVDIAPLPMPGLGEVIGERCVQMHREHGVDLRLGTGITALHGNATGHVEAIELGDGTRIDAQVVVVALGAIPNTEWLEGSRLTLEPGVLCDPTLQAVGAEDVFAAGDIAAWPHPLSPDVPIRIEHWTNAAEQGTLAGRNAVVDPAERREHTSVPMFWSDQYDVKIQAVGLPRLASKIHMAEAAPEGDRFVAIGEREGTVVAAYGWAAARRLPFYRKQVAEGARAGDVLAAAAADPKAFGSAVTA